MLYKVTKKNFILYFLFFILDHIPKLIRLASFFILHSSFFTLFTPLRKKTIVHKSNSQI